MTGKQRMLNAYRGVWNDRPAIAPEFWYYYPAKLLGVDMIAFEREVPFHQALKQTFAAFNCEGWGAAFPARPNARVKTQVSETWRDENTLDVHTRYQTSAGELTSAHRYCRDEPSWVLERPLKNLSHDLAAWEESRCLRFNIPVQLARNKAFWINFHRFKTQQAQALC